MASEFKKYDGVAVTGWTSMFNPLKKGPVVGKRIWDTLADFEKYINDATDSAVPGLIVTIINDGDNNGAYIVKTAAGYNGSESGSWQKLISGEIKQLEVELGAPNSELKIEDNKLTIPDMRTYWEADSFRPSYAGGGVIPEMPDIDIEDRPIIPGIGEK